MSKGNIEKRGKNKYRLTYSYNNNRFRETLEASKISQAKNKLILWIEKIEKRELVSSEYTINEFSELWLEKQIKPNTSGNRAYNKYHNFLDTWFLPQYGDKYINQVSKQTMTEYFNWLKLQRTKYKDREENKILSPNTIKKYKSILHAMFQTALEWEKITINPCNIKIKFYNDISQRHNLRIDYYRYKEYLNVLELIYKEKEIALNSKRNSLLRYSRLVIIEIALKTGLRRSEIFGLTKHITDINLEERMLDINETRQYSKDRGRNYLLQKILAPLEELVFLNLSYLH